MPEDYFNSSLTGEEIESRLLGAVVYNATQNIPEAQRAKARQNISAMEDIAVDSEPRNGSTNLITSGGVYSAMGGVFSPERMATPGALVHFEDGAFRKPIDSMKIAVNPVQNLNGYDHPWPGGGGKNKLENTAATVTKQGLTYTVKADGTVTVNGTATANSYLAIACSLTFDVPSIVSGTPTPIISGVYIAAVAGGSNYNDTTGDGVTIPANTEITAVRMRIDNGVTVSNVVFQPMVRLASETDATFSPFENNCPISGWTAAEIARTGSNLISPFAWTYSNTAKGVTFSFTPENVTITGTSTGSNADSSNIMFKSPIRLIAGQTYIFKIDGTWSTPELRLFLRNSSYANLWYGDTRNCTWTVRPSKDLEIDRVMIRVKAANATFDVSGAFYCNLGSLDAYEPYKGTTYDVSFGSAGTVYGGMLTDNGDGTWTLKVESANIASYNGETLPGKWISSKDVYAPGTMPTVGAQVVYDLASPQTYTLTAPEVITLLLGINNIWADCGEIEELAYRADIGLYLVEALNPIKEMLANREDTMKATRNYTTGDYIIVGNTFYKVLTNIASGTSLTVNGNVRITTVGAELKTALV